MIKWIKEYLFVWKRYRKQRKMASDLYNTKKHALIALAYWDDCNEESDIQFQIEGSSVYIKLGK